MLTSVFQILFVLAAAALLIKVIGRILRWAFQYGLTWYLLMAFVVYLIYYYCGVQACVYAVLAFLLYIIYQRW